MSPDMLSPSTVISDGGAGDKSGPWRDIEIVARRLDHQPPGGLWRLRAEPEKRKARLSKDGESETDRGLDNDRGHYVGRHVPQNKIEVGCSRRPRGFDIGHLRHTERFAAHDPRQKGRESDADRDDGVGDARAKHGADRQRKQQHRKAQERVDQTHERIVYAAAVKAGRHPDGQTEDEAHQHGGDRDSERRASAEHHAIEEVAAKLVSAEPMKLRGRPEARGHSHPSSVIGGNDKRGDNRNENHRDH